MFHKATLILAFVATAGCATPYEELRSEGALVVRAGTSFGMCVGRCSTQLKVDGTEAVLLETSRNRLEPAVTRTLRLEESEWQALAAAAKLQDFEEMAEVYGCPDCADGGAEWVQVEQGGKVRRVTFEYGATVEKIQPLIDRLRAIRDRFPR